jgi:hypothetical protein
LISARRTVAERCSFWRVSAKEAQIHALILAVVLWAAAIGILAFGTTYRDPFNQLKWADFIHFYTLGDIARNGPITDLYDPQTQYQHQIRLVPESAPERYLPVYPPQTAVLFAPLSNLPYHFAATLWALFSVGVYIVSVRFAWRSVQSALSNFSLVAACAVAFPPFWSLILNGQTTAVPILAFTCGAIALAHGRKFLAGLALGLLFMKPQFGLMLALVVLTCGEWSVLAGLLVTACIQLILVLGMLGHTVVFEYLDLLPRLAELQSALEPSAEQMHSIATVARLLPGYVAKITWVCASALVAWMTVRVWRSFAPAYVRMGALVLGSVLVNPHVNLYDAAVLAPPLVSLTGWMQMQSGSSSECERWQSAIYALFALLLFPTAPLIGVQLSPFVLLFLMFALWRTAEGGQSGDGGLRGVIRCVPALPQHKP